MARIPYEDTKVAVSITLRNIEKNLEKVGFLNFAILREDSLYKVVAAISGVTFRWEANAEAVKIKMEDRRAWSVDIEKARRIAWRAIHFGIEAQVKSILCGATSIGQEFGGLTLLPGGQTVAERLTEDFHSGKLISPTVGLLEAPK